MTAKKAKSKQKSGSKTAEKKSGSSAKKATASSTKQAQKKDDIIEIILADHKPLKRLIKIMKDSEAEIEERRSAFEEFTPLLVAHAKSEEKALYEFLKGEEGLREEGFEGDVEHGLADQMVEEAERTDDEDLFSARIKVLAELVEHHLEEEEEDMFPEVRKQIEIEDRIMLGQKYLREKSLIESEGSDDSPSERREEARAH